MPHAPTQFVVRCLVTAFATLTTVLLVLRQGQLVMALFPFTALALGITLYAIQPRLFIGFCMWLWFLTPEVRRVVDYQTGWHAISPVMLTPLLASGLTFVTVLRYFPMFRRRDIFPFAPILLAVYYGSIVGAVRETPAAAVFGFLSWGVPVAFAFHIATAADYPQIRDTLMRTFAWGGLVMGGYGLLQYLFLPPWDAYWMISAAMPSQGLPFPKQVRVFGTMNSADPFATMLMACLIFLFVGGGWIRWPAVALGYCSFLLSLVRTALLGWCIGLFVLVLRMPRDGRLRLISATVATALIVVSTAVYGPFADTIVDRIATLRELGHDTSYQERLQFYQTFLTTALGSVVGAGVGSTSIATKLSHDGQMLGLGYFDSGMMQVPFVLGWGGGAAYAAGVMLLMTRACFTSVPRTDGVAHAANAVTISIFAQMLSDNTLIGVEGMAFWTSLGLALAASRHARAATARIPSWFRTGITARAV
jgi:hypothetical protein